MRIVASQKEYAVYNHPMAVLCLDGLIFAASAEEKNWIIGRKQFYAGISIRDAITGAKRARRFDDVANRYIAANPHCMAINFACGFDTRYWRIANQDCRYIEVDLPEVAAKYFSGFGFILHLSRFASHSLLAKASHSAAIPFSKGVEGNDLFRII